MPRTRNPELLQQIGQRVAQARRDRGWTQEQLAETVGVEPVTMSRWETGDRALSLSTLAAIASALEVPLGDLLDVTRDIPAAEHAPEEGELLRLYRGLSESQQDIILRLARDLAST